MPDEASVLPVGPLEAEHTPAAIAARIHSEPCRSYLRDFVYGSIDGCVTTFAIVSGVVGADLPPGIVLILGFANLLADGFSMAASNFLGTEAERQMVRQAALVEENHIEVIPHGEREEIRQIFRQKGFEGELLDRVVQVITSNRRLWVDTMLREEHGLTLAGPIPWRAALATFGAFVLVGFVPLWPFVAAMVWPFSLQWQFALSCLSTLGTFFGIGALKSLFTPEHWSRAGLETLVVGGGAAGLAYAVGLLLRGVV